MTGEPQLSEEEIHNHPEFLLLQKIIDDMSVVFDSSSAQDGLTVEQGIELVERHCDAVIDNEILTHMSVHEGLRLAVGMIPQQLMGMFVLPFTRMYFQAFLVGAKYQAMKDADLISLPDNFDVSNFLDSTEDTDDEVKAERTPPEIEQVQAVQELPSKDKRNLFKNMLGKKDDSDTTPASE